MPNLLSLNTDGSLQEIKPTVVSLGSGSAGQIPVLGANGQLDPSMVPASGSGPTQAFVIAMAMVMG